MYDRFGRRVYSGLTVAAMVIGGSIMVTLSHGYAVWLGVAMLLFAAFAATAHVLRDWWRALSLRR